MRFAFFGYDMMRPTLERLLADGHHLVALFTFGDESAGVQAVAAEQGALVFTGPPDRAAVDMVDAVIVAGYPWRVPVPSRALALNVHPSLLPKGRGIMPLPHSILDAPEAAGVTVHVLTHRFDAGAIVAQQALPLRADEDVDSLGARIALAAPGLLSRILANPDAALAAAQTQDEALATYFPLPDEAMRRIDWAESWARCAARIRAFGRFGAVGTIEGKDYVLCACSAWAAPHDFAPGDVVFRAGADITIAVRGGFVYLKGV